VLHILEVTLIFSENEKTADLKLIKWHFLFQCITNLWKSLSQLALIPGSYKALKTD